MHVLKKLISASWNLILNLRLTKRNIYKMRLLTSFINKKDPILKEEFHTNNKKYRYLHSTLAKKSKFGLL